MNIMLATKNPGKIAEFSNLLPGITLVGLPSGSPAIEETGKTFSENAILKATAYGKDMPVLADDSGLCVNALHGAPGVMSARFGGDNLDDYGRLSLLLSAMEGVSQRSAKFVCVLALNNGGKIYTFVGKCSGYIALEPRGTNGFGYDSIFIPNGYDKTFGELSSDIKNRISHRIKAVNSLKRKLKHVIKLVPPGV